MSNPIFDPQFNRNLSGALVLVALLFMLGGCSLFGIATKGNLEELSEQQAARDAEQQAQFELIGEQLRSVESSLQASLAEIENQNRLQAEQVTAMKVDMEAAQIQVRAVLADLESLVGVVDVARAESRSAIKMHQDDIYAERDRLQRRVAELDALIRSWQEQPAAASGPADPIILQSLVPEQPAQVLKSPGRNNASQASNGTGDETTVWNRNR